MPRPKRAKIVSQHSRPRTLAPDKISTSTSRTADIPQTQTQAQNNRIQTRRSSRKSGLHATFDQQQIHPETLTLSKTLNRNDGDQENEPGAPALSSDSLRELRKSQSQPRRALQDISSLQQSPNVQRVNHLSPWSNPQKAYVPVEDGFEEYITSSSPQLPPVTISQPPSAGKGIATPSFLSIANFKRRPRQPSILRMVQQDTVDDEESIEKDGPDLTLDTLGDSSPIHIGSSPQEHLEQRSLSSGTKRKASTMESNGQAASTQEQVDEDLELPDHTCEELPQYPAEEDARSASSTIIKPFKKTPPPRRRGRRIIRKQSSLPRAPYSSPPNSASSPHSTPSSKNDVETRRQPQPAQIQRVSKRRKTEEPGANNQTGTTASLQELLARPRARGLRTRKHDTFSIAASSESNDGHDFEDPPIQTIEDEDQDDDEQTYSSAGDEDYSVGPKRGQRQHTATKRGKASTNQAAQRNTKRKAASASLQNQSNRTYGRQSEISAIDKENGEDASFFDSGEPDDEDNDNDEVIRVDDSEENEKAVVRNALSKSKELAAAKKRFQEVDDWELSFESCDVGGQSSSPWR